MRNPQHTTYICTDQTFHPHAHHQVRWLEPGADYELAAAYWAVPLSEDEWLGFAADGYRYAAVIEDGAIVSLAAAWSYSDNAWELAAVSTRPDRRRQGCARSVCSFVTKHILASVTRATCTTMTENVAMRRTAESIGYREQPEHGRDDLPRLRTDDGRAGA